MPVCVYCGDELGCGKCGKEQPIGQTTLACPSKKGALWIHVTDDAGKDIKGVTVQKGDDRAATNKAGIAIFESLDAGAYTTSLPKLEDPIDKSYDPPANLTQPVQVANGTIAYVAYVLRRKAKLKVLVMLKADSSKIGSGPVPFKDLPVNVTLNALPPKPTTEGAFDFEKIPALAHKLTVAFVDGDQKKFDFVESPQGDAARERSITLEPDETETVTFFVLPRPRLKVRFILKPDPSVKNPPEKAFDELPIKVVVDKLPEKQSVKDVADFETVPPGTYAVKVEFVDKVQNKFDFLEPTDEVPNPAEKSITLKAGDEGELVFVVEKLYTKVRFIGHVLAAIPKQVYSGPDDWHTVYLQQLGFTEAHTMPLQKRKEQALVFMDEDDFPPATGVIAAWKSRYFGMPSATDDINARVAFLKSSIERAAAQFDADDSELKIFAVPECFFLGKRGAYELAHFDTLVENLQRLVMGPEWRHWLFAFGTVNFVVPPPTTPQGNVSQPGPIECQNVCPVIRGGSGSIGKASDYTRIIRKGLFSQEMPKDADLEVPRVDLAKATTIDQWNTAVRAELSSEAMGFGFGATENEYIVGRVMQELLAVVEPAIGAETLTAACARLGVTGGWAGLKPAVTQQIASEGLLPVVRIVRKNLVPTAVWARDFKKLLGDYLPVCEHRMGRLMLELLSDFDGGPKLGGESIPSVFLAAGLTEKNWDELKSDVKTRVRVDGIVPTLRLIQAAAIPGTATTLAACHPLGWDAAFKKLLQLYAADKPMGNLLNLVKPGFVFEESFFWCKRRPGPLKDHGEGGVPDNKRVSFGLEICADHGEARMVGATSSLGAKSGIDIQLVISAGMSITPAAVTAKANGFVFNCDGWNFLNASTEDRRIGTYKREYDADIPKDSGHNPLYPHSRLVQVTVARAGQSPARTKEIALPGVPVKLADHVANIFAYDAGELHIHAPQNLPG